MAVRVCLCEETAKQEGREKKRRGRREVRERNPHPSLLLQAFIGKYLYVPNLQVSAKGVEQIREKHLIDNINAHSTTVSSFQHNFIYLTI